eukprot:GDKK01006287.1.p2 GENE.GDKK01006287.1~~GDKK01006287.1.p2  ORF type:complete len:109 (+),score=2.83 GDKK01006287.1:116-442(+)
MGHGISHNVYNPCAFINNDFFPVLVITATFHISNGDGTDGGQCAVYIVYVMYLMHGIRYVGGVFAINSTRTLDCGGVLCTVWVLMLHFLLVLKFVQFDAILREGHTRE